MSFSIQEAGKAAALAVAVIIVSNGAGYSVRIDKTVGAKAIKIEAAPVVVASAKASGAGQAAGSGGGAATGVAALLASANLDSGKSASKKCTACHSFDKGGASKTGPALYGVVGRAKGGAAGFAFSEAIAKKGGTWTFADLDAYLAKPKDFIPGNKMAYGGLAAPEERADLIAYMNKQSDAPLPLPAAPAGAAPRSAAAAAAPAAAQASEADTAGIAGARPHERMAGAPRITDVVHEGGWYRAALTGVEQPYPPSLAWLDDQGEWFNPFTRPGMVGYYDIRGWHDPSKPMLSINNPEAGIGGAKPYQRMGGAPVIQSTSRTDAWFNKALTGVDQPYPPSLSFLKDQGEWFNPFTRPGMVDYYDIRGWHKAAAVRN